VNPYLALVLGVVSAGVGGELFVRGTVKLAAWARIAPGIVGATVAAFATSSPELSVAISSALAQKPQIALGDALGSNVVNVALILGSALLISGIQSSRAVIARDFTVALLVPIVTAILALDGILSRFDGAVLITLFICWLFATVLEVRRQRSAAEEVLGSHRLLPAVISAAIGLTFLVAAGSFIVAGARGIAQSFGISEFIIGATVVALGTSMPELATAIVAKIRGHDEVGLGTILGSNIFNGLFIVSTAAIIHPIALDPTSVGLALAFGLMALVLTFPGAAGCIGRGRGVVLLLLYAAYVAVIVGH
jgi:cation:H+ antiporter